MDRYFLFNITLALCFLVISSNQFETSKHLFSPEGRCVPLDYASRAVERSSPCLGIQCKDGVILLSVPKISEKPITRWSYEREYIHRVDDNIAVALSGINSDCNHVLKILRKEANEHKSNFGVSCSAKKMADTISSYIFDLSRTPSIRPLALSIIIAAIDDENGNELYLVDNTGSYRSFLGCFSDRKLTESWKMKLAAIHFDQLDFNEAINNLKTLLIEIFEENKNEFYGHIQVTLVTSHRIEKKPTIMIFPRLTTT